jgi:hypothetical protein
MRFDIDGLRGAVAWLGTRQAGGNRTARYEKAGPIGMMVPADAGNKGEINRRGGLTAGQTARGALPFRQFDQSVHPRPSSHQGRAADPARCRAVTTFVPDPSRNTGQQLRRQREQSREIAAAKPLLSSC